MLLAIDIGNTNIVLGIYQDNSWQHHWRMQTNVKRTTDEYAVFFAQLLQQEQITYQDLQQVVISSVVPQLTQSIANMLAQQTLRQPCILTYDSQTLIDVATDTPDKTGSDLIANAIAAFAYWQSDCIVVDTGTATTISAISKPGRLLGAAIAPGLQTTLDTLVANTAQLPNIALEAPTSAIGADTISAMQSGLLLGHISMIEGLVARISAELDSPKVIATGGLANTLAPLTDVFDRVDEWLTLDGLRLFATSPTTFA